MIIGMAVIRSILLRFCYIEYAKSIQCPCLETYIAYTDDQAVQVKFNVINTMH